VYYLKKGFVKLFEGLLASFLDVQQKQDARSQVTVPKLKFYE
jgi:hypothetical protein